MGAKSSMTAAVLVSAVLVLTACSGGSDSGGSSASPVVDALRHVPAGSDYVEYGDLAAQRKADNGDDLAGPFASIGDVGDAPLATAGIQGGDLAKLTGIDLRTVTSAVAFGQPPSQVGTLFGSFDTKAIGSKLTALGYAPSDLGNSETVWIVRDNHSVDVNDPLAQLGVVGALNVVHVSSGRIVYGAATSDLDQLSGKGSMADDPAGAGVAGCLGDVKAAVITGTSLEWRGLLGIGVSGDATEQTMVVCVTTSSDAAAASLARSWPGYVGSATMKRVGVPWAKVLSGASATVVGGGGHVVRLSARGVRANVLFQALGNGDLGSLFPGAA